MLTRNDAYAIARAMAKYPPYEGLTPSPMAQIIIDGLQRHMASNRDPAQFTAALRVSMGNELISKIFAEDPIAPPPEPLKRDKQWRILTPADLDNEPDVEWLLDKQIQKNGINVLYGASGLGKSFHALSLSLQIAQTYPVVYVVGEGLAGYNKRVKAWCKHHKMGYGHLLLLDAMVKLMEPDSKEKFLFQVRPLKPQMVVIDTVARAMVGFDENMTRDMGMFIETCDEIKRDLDTAVLLVHHTNKGGEIRGNGSLFNGVDVVLKLSGDDDLLTVEWEKTKDDEKPFPVHFKRVEVEVEVKGKLTKSLVLLPAEQVEVTASKLNNTQAKILECLRLGMDTPDEIVSETRFSRATVYRVLADMVKLNLIKKLGEKQYSLSEEGESTLERISESQNLISLTVSQSHLSQEQESHETDEIQHSFLPDQTKSQYKDGL
jgi:uncharacterized membrane protein